MPTFGPDLLVSLKISKYYQVLEHLEGRVAELYSCRHEYPLWPAHGGNPYDSYERDYYGQIRHVYYASTLELVRTLRKLRNCA